MNVRALRKHRAEHIWTDGRPECSLGAPTLYLEEGCSILSHVVQDPVLAKIGSDLALGTMVLGPSLRRTADIPGNGLRPSGAPSLSLCL